MKIWKPAELHLAPAALERTEVDVFDRAATPELDVTASRNQLWQAHGTRAQRRTRGQVASYFDVPVHTRQNGQHIPGIGPPGLDSQAPPDGLQLRCPERGQGVGIVD